MSKKTAVKLFEQKQIRSQWNENSEKWYFSIIDIIAILSEQANYQGARNYWKVLKHRLKKEGSETVTNCNRLKLEAPDGKMRETDCANKEGLFRIIQSIPSKKAEPFKLWLAKVGSERIDEIENPELAQERMKLLYEQKGYPKNWIDKRLRGIAIRQDLTDEWKNRGVEDNKDFAILTNEISKATFGKTVEEYKQHKNLTRQNLRDHMDDIELILTMFSEATTTRLTRERNSKQFPKLKKDAKDGGKVAGNARKDFEKTLGKSIVSEDNYLDSEKRKLIGKD